MASAPVIGSPYDWAKGPGPLFVADADGDMVYEGSDDPEKMLRDAGTTRVGREWAEGMIKRAEEQALHVSPPGSLGLPRLLEKRRLAAGIPDKFFRYQATYNRVFVYQIPYCETTKVGSIHMTEDSKAQLEQSAPRGIIVSAGLDALDSLYTNGGELGDILTLQKSTPYRFPVMFIAGIPQYMIIMTSGEACGNEDVCFRLWKGDLKLMRGPDDRHFYKRVNEGAKSDAA